MLDGLKWLDVGRVADVGWTEEMVGCKASDRC